MITCRKTRHRRLLLYVVPTVFAVGGAAAAVKAGAGRFLGTLVPAADAATSEIVVQQAPHLAAMNAMKVSIAKFAFGPKTVSVKVGEGVSWSNNDGTSHTVTFKDGSAGAKALSPGQSFTRTFDKAGSYDYFCSIHPYMTGRVEVK